MRTVTRICLICCLLLITVRKLPAPIVEEEKPTPAPEQSAKPKPKRTIKPKVTSESSERSTKRQTSSPPPQSTAAPTQPRYSGTWRGTINCSIWEDVEHIIVIDDAQK